MKRFLFLILFVSTLGLSSCKKDKTEPISICKPLMMEYYNGTIFRFTYDGFSNLVKIGYEGKNDYVQLEYSNQKISKLNSIKNGNIVASAEVSYDTEKRITKMVFAENGATKFSLSFAYTGNSLVQITDDRFANFVEEHTWESGNLKSVFFQQLGKEKIKDEAYTHKTSSNLFSGFETSQRYAMVMFLYYYAEIENYALLSQNAIDIYQEYETDGLNLAYSHTYSYTLNEKSYPLTMQDLEKLYDNGRLKLTITHNFDVSYQCK